MSTRSSSMTTNNGKEAEKAFLERLRGTPGVIIERFYDQADLRGINKGRAVADFSKPSDFLVTEAGSISYREVKSVQSATSFPFANIEKGQRSAALRQAAVGGDYRFHLFSYGLGQWFVMTARQFAEALEGGASSIKFQDLETW